MAAAATRRALILDMLKAGVSGARIAAALGISKQRVYTILKRCPPAQVAAARARARECRTLISAAVGPLKLGSE